MDLIADGLLLAAALVAIFYCWAVSRRLGQLQKQAADLTGKLENLDKTVREVRSAIAEGRTLAEQERDRLGHLVKNADTLRRDLQRAAVTLEKSVSKAELAEAAEAKAPTPTPTPPPERGNSLARVKRLNKSRQRRDVA